MKKPTYPEAPGILNREENFNLVSNEAKNTIHKGVIPAGTDIGLYIEADHRYQSQKSEADSSESGISIPEEIKNFLQRRKKHKSKIKTANQERPKVLSSNNSIENSNSGVENCPSKSNSTTIENSKSEVENCSSSKSNSTRVITLAEIIRKKKHRDGQDHQLKQKTMVSKLKEKTVPLSSTESDSSISLRGTNSSHKSMQQRLFKIIVHQDPSSRKFKPVEKLLDLPAMHNEYFRHLSYAGGKRFDAPKHEIQKCKYLHISCL